jgi:hypothetical protein
MSSTDDIMLHISCRVNMKLLYCGFNGFGQCPATRASTLPQLTEFPVTGVKEVSVAWSCMVVLTGEQTGVSVTVGMFLGGNWFQSWLDHKLLPDGEVIYSFSQLLQANAGISTSIRSWLLLLTFFQIHNWSVIDQCRKE